MSIPASRTKSPCVVCLAMLFVAGSILPAPGAAAQGWSWPEHPENLQVLPSDWSGRRLAPVMRGFSRSLGVRCQYCHVGEEGQPLSEFDFASDDNPNKDRAREMLRMLGSINDHLDKIEVSGDQPVNMWCHTCHRGRPKPMTLAEELGASYRADGIEAAIARYSELRESFYGRGAYDFGEDGLNEFGYSILEDDVDGAIAAFTLNAEMHGESANVWDSLAEGHMNAGHTDLAIEYYEKSLALEPRNRNAQEKLDELRGGKE